MSHINWAVVFSGTVAGLQTCAAVSYFLQGRWKAGVLWACWSLGNVMVILIERSSK